jgi:uncharacterized protein (UPF0335 family)
MGMQAMEASRNNLRGNTMIDVTGEQLKAIVERIERLEEERKTFSDNIKDVYAEAKAEGYDTKILKQVIRIRAQDKSERAEQEAILDLYLNALGMVQDGGNSDE